VFDALEHASVDARQRKIVWAGGKRLSIEQSVARIHAGHPRVACELPSVPTMMRQLPPGSLDPKARKDHLAYAHAPHTK